MRMFTHAGACTETAATLDPFKIPAHIERASIGIGSTATSTVSGQPDGGGGGGPFMVRLVPGGAGPTSSGRHARVLARVPNISGTRIESSDDTKLVRRHQYPSDISSTRTGAAHQGGVQ